MRPDRDAVHPLTTLPDLLRMELAARRLSGRKLAKKAGVSERTLNHHASGKHPIPADEARQILDALDAEGPFRLPALREELVILGGTDRPRTVLHPETAKVDTLHLLLDPAESVRPALIDFLNDRLSLSPRKNTRKDWYWSRWHGGGEERTAGIVVSAEPRLPGGAWLRLQVAPWDPWHQRFFHWIDHLVGDAASWMSCPTVLAHRDPSLISR